MLSFGAKPVEIFVLFASSRKKLVARRKSLGSSRALARWWLRVGEERGGVSRSLEECTKNMTNTHHMNTCRRCVRVVCTKGVYKR
ncbi:hypothetical protein HOP50_01g01640 [Chloropicon primus]|nr:hypothetical protein HOP50_01g01640 [Chloropicon primus]